MGTPMLPESKFKEGQAVRIQKNGFGYTGVIKALPFMPNGPYSVEVPGVVDDMWVDERDISAIDEPKQSFVESVRLVKKRSSSNSELKPIPRHGSAEASASNIVALPEPGYWIVRTQAGFRRLYKHINKNDGCIDTYPSKYPAVVRRVGGAVRYIKSLELEISSTQTHLSVLMSYERSTQMDATVYSNSEIQQALAIAERYHADQKYGLQPYMTAHVIPVLNAVIANPAILATKDSVLLHDACVAAIFHDIIEDTDCTISELSSIASPRAIKAIQALTKRRKEKRKDYLARVVDDSIAVVVKWEDAKLNLTNSLESMHPERIEKYGKTLSALAIQMKLLKLGARPF